VIEEAPSSFLDEETRQKMGEQAVTLARAVEYESAGTVEFIVDSQRNFFFLEMNTRLQVEHPVTELITGIDLVELMIKIAAGDKLPIRQSDVGIKGWAIESRVYAEDPSRNFLPSIGRLVNYVPPQENHNVRVDTGVYEGGEVSMYYDPMIAKLITYGATRDEAIAHMRSALDSFVIRGVSNNLNFLSSLMHHQRFVDGNISTNMIGEEYPEGFDPAATPHPDPSVIVSVAASALRKYRDRAGQIDGQLHGHERKVPDSWVLVMSSEHHRVRVIAVEGGYQVTFQDNEYKVLSDWEFGQNLFSGSVNGQNVHVQIQRHDQKYRLTHNGFQVDLVFLNPRVAELFKLMPVKAPPDMSRFLLSPMPGLLVSLAVEEGDNVNAGEELAVLEAMKMENTLRAERDCVVAKINFQPGANLAVDDKIIEFQ
jgi:propionyl-CoA carboxylase alpha chain